ncbi:hypothetical protein QBC37DRAFT_482849 [Rhypophila decipiens]|uniref:Mid2 domain-containing protein n=1 Tax=Rhypophila decipiens TaxID=261697 RepID=A0AAN7B5L1_9PEZI|nr:hypothetical protein QBC37DRAFT_482849 [Rhypophila decipiens]
MLGVKFAPTLFWALSLLLFPVVLSTPSSPLDVSIRTRNLPGHSDQDTFLAIRRRFAASPAAGHMWQTVPRPSIHTGPMFPSSHCNGGVSIHCTKCYVRGVASVQLTVDSNGFNLNQTITELKSEIEQEIDNLTTTVFDAAEQFIDNFELFGDRPISFDNYTIDADFDIDIPALPECQLKFQFDGLELYLELGISFNGTYTIPIFKSQSSMGISVGDELLLGVVLTIDLILSVDADIELGGGFHINNGAAFEFLPVTVFINEVVLTAVLRLGIRAGIDVSTPELQVSNWLAKKVDGWSMGAGVEVGVFAHVAELLTSISPADPEKDSDCQLAMRQEYTLAVGANADATAHFGDNTWGPQVETTTPIFYTTMSDGCAAAGVTATVAAALAGRAGGSQDNDLVSTTTTETEVKYTGVSCIETGRVNCPMSLQKTLVKEVTLTLSTAVSSGQDVDWDDVTAAVSGRGGGVGGQTVEFGAGVKRFGGTSGVPTSFVPPSETGPGSGGFEVGGDGSLLISADGGLSTIGKIVIGVSVGVGVPVLVGLIVGIWCCCRKRRQKREPVGPGMAMAVGPSQQQTRYYEDGSKPTGNVVYQVAT